MCKKLLGRKLIVEDVIVGIVVLWFSLGPLVWLLIPCLVGWLILNNYTDSTKNEEEEEENPGIWV